MTKKYLWIAILIFGFISCEAAPNDFTAEANAFLDAIDEKDYIGEGGWTDSTFKVNGVVIAQHGNATLNPLNEPLFFQPDQTTGTSATRAIYRYRKNTGVQGDYVGIEIENSGNTLKRTLPTPTPNVDWSTVPIFATR